MSRFTLLTGAKRNVGDFLIGESARRLIERERPDVELDELPRWRSLERHLDAVNASDALVLCGGPALQQDMYPGVYPLVSDLRRIETPIVGLGLGWKGIPGDERSLQHYRFTDRSRRLLARIEADSGLLGCRDHLSRRVLERHGCDGALTGDPAWYDPERFGTEFASPSSFDRIVLSAPAGPTFFDQCVALAEELRGHFDPDEILCAFHHGWEEGEHLPTRMARGLQRLRENLDKRGFATVALDGSLSKMKELYRDADFHIGYRLHAHLFRISQRMPSVLLEEDGRGRGASETLDLRGVRAWRRTPLSSVAPRMVSLPAADRLLRWVERVRLLPRERAVDECVGYVRLLLDTGFATFTGLGQMIDQWYGDAMRPFIKALPGPDHRASSGGGPKE